MGSAGKNSDLVSIVSATVGNIPAFRNAEEKNQYFDSLNQSCHRRGNSVLSMSARVSKQGGRAWAKGGS